MEENRELIKKNREVLKSWEQYKKSLLRLSSKKSFAIGKESLEEILSVSLSYPKSLDEILEIARYSYQKTQEKLRPATLLSIISLVIKRKKRYLNKKN